MRFSYHAFSDEPGLNTCSAYSDEAPLVVNCAGNIVLDKPHTTDNKVGREDFYLIYITKGEMDVPLGDEKRVATAGDVIIFPPHYRYRYNYLGGETLEYVFVHFTGSYAERLLQICGFSPLPFLHSTSGGRKIAESVSRFTECVANTSKLQKYELSVMLEGILLSIANSLTDAAPGHTLENSLQIIHTSYHSAVRIPELAKSENLSHSRYVELFRRQFGVSPMAYLIRLRIQVATRLLESTDLPISKIAAMTSYEDQHFFSKLFKKHVGISPTEYRSKRT